MRLLIKTDLEMPRLVDKLNRLYGPDERGPVADERRAGEAFVGFLIPPDIGQLTLYQNTNPVQFEDAAEWPFVLSVEKLPVQSKEQAESCWTQLKMLGCHLGAINLASAVLAVRAPGSGIERTVSE